MPELSFLFAGTPEFALASLKALHGNGYVPAAVLTQPDRPAGRGRKLTFSPVKRFALENDLPVWQPVTLKDPERVAQIAAVEPDLIVVAAYGLILPQAILDIPLHGCLNVHASLLPRWRGAAPIQQAILQGDADTGISLMKMETGLDTGPVYARLATPIDDTENAGQLHDRLARMGGELLLCHIDEISSGSLVAVAQDDSEATYAGKIRKRDASIMWLEPASDIARKIRAYNPVPGACFEFAGEIIKCFAASPLATSGDVPGTVLAAGKAGIDVACGEGALRLLEVQRPGRRRVRAADFASQVKPQGKRFGWIS